MPTFKQLLSATAAAATLACVPIAPALAGGHGYGHFYPDTLYGHMVATVEIMVGMFGLAVITGLIFVRFSRPTARLVFSRRLVISPFDGQPALMMRVAAKFHRHPK